LQWNGRQRHEMSVGDSIFPPSNRKGGTPAARGQGRWETGRQESRPSIGDGFGTTDHTDGLGDHLVLFKASNTQLSTYGVSNPDQLVGRFELAGKTLRLIRYRFIP